MTPIFYCDLTFLSQKRLSVTCQLVTQSKYINRTETRQKERLTIWITLRSHVQCLHVQCSHVHVFAVLFRVLSRKKMTGDDVLCKNQYLLCGRKTSSHAHKTGSRGSKFSEEHPRPSCVPLPTRGVHVAIFTHLTKRQVATSLLQRSIVTLISGIV